MKYWGDVKAALRKFMNYLQIIFYLIRSNNIPYVRIRKITEAQSYTNKGQSIHRATSQNNNGMEIIRMRKDMIRR